MTIFMQTNFLRIYELLVIKFLFIIILPLLYISPATAQSSLATIAFASDKDGNYELYTIKIDGSELQQLTFTTNCINSHPSWATSGTEIAFHSNCDGNWNIYKFNVNENAILQLTSHHGENQFPSWSPDGTHIAFTHHSDADREIYLMNPDGSGLQNLTNNQADDWWSTWSPDSSRIAYLSDSDGNADIYLLDISTGETDQLTDLQENFYSVPPILSPVWSPDGSRIAVISLYPDGYPHLYLVDTLSGDMSEVVGRENINQDIMEGLSWSSDSNYLVFVGDTNWEDSGNINILNLLDGTLTNVINSGDAISPAWSIVPNAEAVVQEEPRNQLCHPAGYCVEIPIGWEGSLDTRPNHLLLSRENMIIAVELTRFENLDLMVSPEIQNTRIGLHIESMGASPTGIAEQITFAGYPGTQQDMRFNSNRGKLISLIIRDDIEGFVTALRLDGGWSDEDDQIIVQVANSLIVPNLLDVSRLDG